ncbi:coiled-coil and C2 domain-containing protein 1-like isoform X2 [Anabrus simplex]|uniref:coiled-coil and C2 domain-containing protein 1-like isoform X2 n=1 Tax=Anabrus simplex TaxID=316456 RepID=UPI0035A3B73E
MFSKKKEERRRPNAGSGLSQFGLLDIPDINNIDGGNMMDDDDDDLDDDLEAELLAITAGSAPARPKRVRPSAPPKVDLDAMVADSLRDIPSDEELSGDEDDPELLHELSALNEDESPPPEVVAPTPRSPPDKPKVSTGNSLVSLLEERLKMYQEAEKNAKTAGESSRARRFGRGIKTLNDLIKQARAGRVVNEEDIPPPVVISAITKPAPAGAPAPAEESSVSPQVPAPSVAISEPDPPAVPSRPAPLPPPPSVPRYGVALPGLTAGGKESESSSSSVPAVDKNTLNILTTRRDQYKLAALQAKRSGDTDTAIKFVKISKQFDRVIAAVESGQPVDLSAMPPPPPSSLSTTPQINEPRKEESRQQGEANDEGPSAAVPQEEGEVDESIYNAPPAPATVLEALQQRLAKYQSCEQQAKEEGNASKARRMGRIVKQYEGAIKLHKAGKPIPVDELPTPPGFGPIPVEGGAAAIPAAPAPSPRPVAPAPPVTPVPSPRPSPSIPVTPATPTSPQTPKTPATPSSPAQPSAEKTNVRKSPQSRQEKQLSFLIARQREFKEAALKAKQNGELNQAKEYLRLAKGFDPLIEASHSGLPVDMTSVPVPPDTKVILESDFDIITIEDCIPGSDAEIFEKLEEDLSNQAKMCLNTRDHFKAIGDVASANRFEQLALHAKKDLNAVRCAHRRSEPLPKFHYETKSFSIVQCNTELGDNDLELTIVQGINYNVSNPKDVDTYVRFEFPYPAETPYKDKTVLIKDTNNPQYNQAFMIPIQRNVRACQRVFKRQNIKLEVWSRGGFLRSDTLIGTVNVKLSPLETKCTLHDSFDLMDGRKTVGGKLEVKVRLRNPIVTKQVEQVQEKWLIIDSI